MNEVDPDFDRADKKQPKPRTWLRLSFVGNVLLSAAQLGTAVATGSNTLAASSLQTFDGTTYSLLDIASKHEDGDNLERARRYRKIAALSICGAALAVGAKSGVDLLTHQNTSVEADAAVLVVASGAMNIAVSRKLHPYADPGSAHRDGWRHSTGDAISAVAATGAILASGLGVHGVDSAVAVVTSGFTIWVNYPTAGRMLAPGNSPELNPRESEA